MKANIMTRMAIAAMVLLSVISFTSCEEDGPGNKIWDFTPVYLTIDITDGNGATLLDSAREDNVLNSDIYMEFEGKRYELNHRDSIHENIDGRAYMAEFYGFWLDPVYEKAADGSFKKTSRYRLFFGEWNGDDNYDYHMTLVWPEEGKSHELRVYNHFRWKGHNPDIDRHYYLDGLEVTKLPIVVRR
ncbi:MAG: hypothetical protein NC342_06055 [Pseudoflavonifractor sp.]|nr:hypothetical protein [Alloprevotella sp.]MCM1117080.1 hypothetical protein [Pseudoflavonifractor sp.]